MKNNRINYIEFKAKDLEKVKEFYSQAFDWTFQDYGAAYTAFSDGALDGGFTKSDESILNGALVILYHENLEEIKRKIIDSKGIISIDIYPFPGGRRFHFRDPAGNELAVWSDQ